MTRIRSILPYYWVLLLMGYAMPDSSAALPSSPHYIRAAGAKVQTDSLFISCSPERPVVSLNGFIQLKAWATTSEGKPFTGKLTYDWSVRTGRIRDKTAEATWDLKNAKPGNYIITVQAMTMTPEVAECSLQIQVESSEPSKDIHTNENRALRETGRFFLLPAQQEHKGYGLYSYLLFGGPPNDGSRERYLKAIEAYLALLPDITRLEKYFAPSELNITYLPIDAIPPDIIDIKLLARWVLDHYDYSRSRFLIRQLSEDNRDGPYVVSVAIPLGGSRPLSNYLWQDLSAVPAQFAGSWIKEFMNQAAQERFWETRSLSQLRLKIRTTIAVLAIALPAVQNSLDSYIKLRQSLPQ